MSDAELLRELAYIKAIFQLRTIETVIRGPEHIARLQPAQRVDRRKVHSLAQDIRRAFNMPESGALRG